MRLGRIGLSAVVDRYRSTFVQLMKTIIEMPGDVHANSNPKHQHMTSHASGRFHYSSVLV